MGYIFEALQKAGSTGVTPAQPAASPAPVSSAAAAPSAPAAPPVSAAAPPPRVVWSEQVLADSCAELDARLVVIRTPGSAAAEEYRAIRTRLTAAAAAATGIYTLTSATPQEGRTLSALNLAAAFGEIGRGSTLVIEADLRRPSFQKLLGWPESPGLLQVLQHNTPLDEAIRPLKWPSLHVLHSGGKAGVAASEILGSPKLRSLLDTLRTRYDSIIVDTPAVLEFADAGILGSISDQVILAVRINRTPRPLVDRAVRALESYRARVTGVILTESDPPSRSWRHA